MSSRRVSAIAGVVIAAVASAACTGDGGGDDPSDTVASSVVDGTTAPDYEFEIADPTSADTALADGVTADELTQAFEGFVQCLADNGAYGEYSYDIALETSLSLEWMLPDDTIGARANALDRACSAAYLGKLSRSFYGSTASADDLDSRRRDSIRACLQPVSPDAADAVPDDLVTDTGTEGYYVGDVQRDVEFLGGTQDNAAAISRCFATLGAPWNSFGSPPDGSPAPSEA